MNLTQWILILVAVLIAGGVYFLLRKVNITATQKKWVRIVLFGSMISFLAFDFYSKQKYALLIILALGFIAFVYMILKSKDK